jgi:hypothetical protein
MNRAYGTLIIRVHVQRVKTRCYKMFRAEGSIIKRLPIQIVIEPAISIREYVKINLRCVKRSLVKPV